MKKSEKLVEMKRLWNRDTNELWTRDVRSIDWDSINWDKGTYDGDEWDDNCILQEHFVQRATNDIKDDSACFFVFGEYCEASGWIDWDYALACWLYAWYQQPDDSFAPFFVDESALVICIPDLFSATHIARLFDGPHAALLGVDGVEEKVVKRNHLKRALRSTIPAAKEEGSSPLLVS